MLSVKKATAKHPINTLFLIYTSSLFTQSHHHYNAATISPLQSIQSHHCIPIKNRLPVLYRKEVAQSFTEWFRRGRNPFLDQIFALLTSQEEEALSFWLFSQLGLRLSESFVLDVLKYGVSHHDLSSCLSFFDWAGHQGFYHTRATYHVIFKILSRRKLFSVVTEYLDDIVNAREKMKQYNPRFYPILVMGYAIAGKTDVALEHFGRMRFQGIDLDLFSYCVLVNALVEGNNYEKADAIWKQMKLRSIESSVTHSLKIKSLCRQKMLDEAVVYLRELLVKGNGNGYERAGQIILDGLCEDGRFDEAWELVEEFKELDMVKMEMLYGAWIKNLVRAGKVDMASRFLKDKKELEGYVPDIFRYNLLLCRLLRDNCVDEVCDLLVDMEESGICPDWVTMNAALCFFCKAGMVDVALDLHNSMTEFRFTPNTIAFNYLINCLCGAGNYSEACQLLWNCTVKEYFPSSRTLSILANALYREGKHDLMMELCRVAMTRNLKLSDSTYDKFINALCRSSRVDDGYRIFEELDSKDKVASGASYKSLIYGFKRLNKGEIAARLLIDMQDKGHMITKGLIRSVIGCLCEMDSLEMQVIKLLTELLQREPRNEIYNAIIYGAGHAKRPDVARKVYDIMERDGIVPNLESKILVLLSYLRNHKISDAMNFFTLLNQGTHISKKLYNTIIVGLCKAKKEDYALDYLKEMKNHGWYPSMECYELLIWKLCRDQNYGMAVDLINGLEEEGRRITTFIGNTLFLHSLKSEKLYECWVQSRKLGTETSILGQLIGAFSGGIRLVQQIEDFEELIQQCFPLDLFTYNVLLRRVSISEMDHAFTLFNRICQKGYKPNQWTYDIILHGLCKHGRIAEARRWAEKMYSIGIVPTWSTRRFLQQVDGCDPSIH